MSKMKLAAQHKQQSQRRDPAPSRSSFKLIVVKAEPTVYDGKYQMNFDTIKELNLIKGMSLEAAKRSCDIMQGEYDRECAPVRVYLHVLNDRCPIHAGLCR